MTSRHLIYAEFLLAAAVESGGADWRALRDGVPALGRLLCVNPATAPSVLRIIAHAAWALRRLEPGDVICMHDAATRAGLLAGSSGVDRDRIELIDLYVAESAVLQQRTGRAVEILDQLTERLSAREETTPLSAYMAATARCLRGRLHEAGLDRNGAVRSYEAAADFCQRMNRSPRQRADLLATWSEAVTGDALIKPQLPEETAFTETVGDLSVWALSGLLRLTPAGTAAEKTIAKRLMRAFERYGVPGQFQPRELIGVVEAITRALGSKYGRAFEHEVDENQLPVVYAAIAKGLAATGDMRMADTFRAFSMQFVFSESAPIAAGIWARVFRWHHGALAQSDVLADHALKSMSEWGFAEATLADKADVEPVLEDLFGAVLRQWERIPNPYTRQRLAALIEMMKRPVWLPVRGDHEDGPAENNSNSDDEPGPDSKRRSWFRRTLYEAADWIGRAQQALTERPDTALLVIQSCADSTVYLCIDRAPTALCSATALHVEQPVSSALAESLPSELDFALLSGVPAGAGFVASCCEAYRELPELVRDMISGHQTLLVVPDVRADSAQPPIEILHDGDGYLGARRVIARVPSLRDAVRVLEGTIAPLTRRRAVVAAFSAPPGAPVLLHARSEIDFVHSLLTAADWDVARVCDETDDPSGSGDAGTAQQDLQPQRLLEILGHVSVAHIAGHGVDIAGEESLIFRAGRLTVDQVTRQRHAHLPFVYLDTCSLGSTRYLGGGARRGMAQALIEAGAPAVVANLTPVDDVSATEVAVEFYDHALTQPIGESLRRARAVMAKRGVHPVMWGGTVLMGDPALRLPAAEPAIHQPRSLADQILDAAIDPGGVQPSLPILVEQGVAELERNPENIRLLLTIALLHGNALIQEYGAEETETRVQERRYAARLADDLGHAASAVTMRVDLGASLALSGRPVPAAAELESILPAVDVLAERDTKWREFRLETYGKWLRIAGFERGDNRIILEIDGSPEQRDRALNQMLGAAAIAEYWGREVRWRLPERRGIDVLANAVLLGYPHRFRSVDATREIGAILHSRLADFGVLPRDHPFAPHALSGAMALLWSGLIPEARSIENAVSSLLLLTLDLGHLWASADFPLSDYALSIYDLVIRLWRLRGASKSSARHAANQLRSDILGIWEDAAAQPEVSETTARTMFAFATGVAGSIAASADSDVREIAHRTWASLKDFWRADPRLHSEEMTGDATDVLSRWRQEDGLYEPVTIIWD